MAGPRLIASNTAAVAPGSTPADVEAAYPDPEDDPFLFIARLPPLHLCTPAGREHALPPKAPGAPRATLVRAPVRSLSLALSRALDPAQFTFTFNWAGT